MVFYDISDAGRSYVSLGEGNDWESIVCPVDDGHQRAGRRITQLHLALESKTVVDFSWTCLSDVVITDHALQILMAASLTGFRVEPTKVVSHRKQRDKLHILEVWEFVVSGTAGHTHRDSGILLKSTCEACGRMRYAAHEHGIVVDEAQWDSSDFFCVVESPYCLPFRECGCGGRSL